MLETVASAAKYFFGWSGYLSQSIINQCQPGLNHQMILVGEAVCVKIKHAAARCDLAPNVLSGRRPVRPCVASSKENPDGIVRKLTTPAVNTDLNMRFHFQGCSSVIVVAGMSQLETSSRPKTKNEEIKRGL